jgi:hypothetical protein
MCAPFEWTTTDKVIEAQHPRLSTLSFNNRSIMRFIMNEIQVKLLIKNNSFCFFQRAIEQSKTGNFRDYCSAKAPSGLT